MSQYTTTQLHFVTNKIWHDERIDEASRTVINQTGTVSLLTAQLAVGKQKLAVGEGGLGCSVNPCSLFPIPYSPLRRIDRAGARLRTLIDDLLTLSRAQRIELRLELISSRQMIIDISEIEGQI